MIKKILASAALVVVLTVSVLTGTTHAQSEVPNYACLTSCSSVGGWGATNPTVYGTSTSVTIDNPGMGTSTEAVYDKYVTMIYNSYNLVLFGEEKEGPDFTAGSFCTGHPRNNPYYFLAVQNGGQRTVQNCYAVPSNDINGPATLKVENDGSGSMAFFTDGVSSGSACYSGCAFSVSKEGYYSYEYEVAITDTFTGHHVWGGAWGYNKWENSGGTWSYQAVLFNNPPIHANNPPQFYWVTTPPDDYTGGNLYSCVYDSGTTCTFGS